MQCVEIFKFLYISIYHPSKVVIHISMFTYSYIYIYIYIYIYTYLQTVINRLNLYIILCMQYVEMFDFPYSLHQLQHQLTIVALPPKYIDIYINTLKETYLPTYTCIKILIYVYKYIWISIFISSTSTPADNSSFAT
jgi:hypothetical protein